MKLMTAATVSNPNSLGKLLPRIGESMSKERAMKQTADLGKEFIKSVSQMTPEQKRDQDYVLKSFQDIASKYPMANTQAAVKMVNDVAMNARQDLLFSQGQKDRETKRAREETLFNQGQEDRSSEKLENMLKNQQVEDMANLALQFKDANDPDTLLGQLRDRNNPALGPESQGRRYTNQTLLGGYTAGMQMRPKKETEEERLNREKLQAQIDKLHAETRQLGKKSGIDWDKYDKGVELLGQNFMGIKDGPVQMTESEFKRAQEMMLPYGVVIGSRPIDPGRKAGFFRDAQEPTVEVSIVGQKDLVDRASQAGNTDPQKIEQVVGAVLAEVEAGNVRKAIDFLKSMSEQDQDAVLPMLPQKVVDALYEEEKNNRGTNNPTPGKDEPVEQQALVITKDDLESILDTKILGMDAERSGNSPISMVQAGMSKLPVYQAQKNKFPLPGETEIAYAVRIAYGMNPLQDRKRISAALKKRYPDLTEKQIAEAILKGAHQSGNMDDHAQHLLEQ